MISLDNFKEFVRYSFSNFKTRKMRSWLTMLGIFIGIAAVVSLVSLGQGLQEAVNQQFETLGVDKIFVLPGSSLLSSIQGGGPVELTKKDFDAVEKVQGVKMNMGFVFKILKTTHGREVDYTYIISAPEESNALNIYFDSFGLKLLDGRFLKAGDKHKAVVGYLHAIGDFFDKKMRVGDKILINDEEFTVVGTVDTIGNPQDDTNIYIMEDVARVLFDEPEKYDTFIAQVADETEVDIIAEKIKKSLRKVRDLEEGEEDFTIQTTQELLDSYNTILVIIQAVVIGIALISLMVGGIGIANTMFTSVLERTKEIGIMKSIGATNNDIFSLFLIESGLLGLVGGIIGIVLGVGFSKLVSFAAQQALKSNLFQSYFPWYLIVGALIFSVVVGGLAGLVPAMNAAKQKPVDSLRYE